MNKKKINNDGFSIISKACDTKSANSGFSIISGACDGFSIIEMLVTITIFAAIGILTTRAISLTLRGSKKSDSTVRVRENLNYSMGIIERQIRNADRITQCPLADSLTLPYVSLEGIASSFSCNLTAPGYIASGSATTRLTSGDIAITDCAFTCSQINKNNPPIITVNLTAEDATQTGTDKASVSSQTEIVVRNY
jgi:prepilin-type N-terminal cleavage/methylation domain-containing protein